MKKIIYILLFVPLFANGQTSYYISPTGNNGNLGTYSEPWATSAYAVTQMDGGDTLYFLSGTYYPTSKTIIGSTLSGTSSNRTYFGAYSGDVILDYSNYDQPNNPPVPPHIVGNSYAHAFYINHAGFVTIENLEIKNVMQVDSFCEITVIGSFTGSNLTLQNISIHDCEGRGIFHETPWGYTDEPSYDTLRIINCDIYNLFDGLPYTFGAIIGNQADGLKCYGNNGTVLIIQGNRVWNVSDDGMDGGLGLIWHVYNNWFFNNGWYVSGDGDGFKCGGNYEESSEKTKFIKNNIFASNNEAGFVALEYEDYWRNYGEVYNNIFYGNGKSGIGIEDNSLEGRENIGYEFRNNISINNYNRYPQIQDDSPLSAPYMDYIEDHNNWDDIGGYPGWQFSDTVNFTVNDWLVTDSTEMLDQLMGDRQADGSLPSITAFRNLIGSRLDTIGVDVGMSNPAPIGIDWAWLDAQDASTIPILSTTLATSIWTRAALSGGIVASDEGDAVTARGVCWNTSANPTTSNSKTVNGTGEGSFSSQITGLSPSTTYYVRAYATNGNGTAYGSQVSFTTPAFSRLNATKPIMYNGKKVIIR